MYIAMLRGDKYLPAVLIRERERLPFTEIWRLDIAVYHNKIKFPVHTGDELPCLFITMNTSQDITSGNRNIVLNKFAGYPLTKVLFLIVCLYIFAAKVLEYGWFDQKYSV